ncbi:MAG: SRPBCC family protein [Pseudonocardiaceae bacterium]
MTETLRTVDGHGVLRIERTLTHPVDKVWRALTEPAHLSRWFPSAMEIDLRAGGTVHFVFPGGEAPPMDGTITDLDPPRVFAYTWGDDHLHWELRPSTEGSLLIFTHTFGDRAGAASFAAGWEVCIDALDMVLNGRPVEFSKDMNALHEHYIDKFGLAEGSAEVTDDGWRVRFERQLTRPVETIWGLLTAPGPQAPAAGAQPPHGCTCAEVPAGTITEVHAPRLLEYEWRDGGRPVGRVRWELTQGTGHGARLMLTQTGPSELAQARSTALTAWQAGIELLAATLLTPLGAVPPT